MCIRDRLGIDEEEKLQLKFKTLELLENSDIGNPTETASCYDAILNVLNITIDELGNTDVNLDCLLYTSRHTTLVQKSL